MIKILILFLSHFNVCLGKCCCDLFANCNVNTASTRLGQTLSKEHTIPSREIGAEFNSLNKRTVFSEQNKLHRAQLIRLVSIKCSKIIDDLTKIHYCLLIASDFIIIESVGKELDRICLASLGLYDRSTDPTLAIVLMDYDRPSNYTVLARHW